MKKIFIALFLLLTLGCIACDKSPEQVKLAKPIVSLNGDVASWEAVENASGYVYKITDTAIYTTDLFVKLNDNESIIVKAVGDVNLYQDSDYSDPVTFNRVISSEKLNAPVISVDKDGVVSWVAVNNATEYICLINGQEITTHELYYVVEDEDVIKVKAKGDGVNYLDSDYSNELTYIAPEPPVPAELKETTVYLVGDSTVCSFSDSTYFYPRYGYGTQLSNYLHEKANVRNLALSGRSSKSFVTEGNYSTLVNNLSKGDYLIIGFGHNDQKSDEESRFTDATKPLNDPTSFKYSLYEHYIKLAIEKGATPILCTPIVRASSSDNYSGSNGHVTATGDYRNAIIELGVEVGVTVIDLTQITANRYKEIGYSEAIYYHAMTTGKYDTDNTTVIADTVSVDTTHLNIYGAKFVAYNFAMAIKNSDNTLGMYVLEGLEAPTKEKDLVSNPNYVVLDYSSPALNTYSPPSQFSTISDGWFGTAFGDCGGTPSSSSNGYYATEVSEGVFKVGQSSGSNKGKFADAGDGFALLFKQVSVNDNFKLSVKATITTSAGVKQAGFGLMLRDDCFINQNTSKAVVTSNYLTAGILQNDESNMSMLFYRENGKIQKSANKVAGVYSAEEEVTLSIERIGQAVTTTVVYKGTTYTKTYYDFDLFAIDGSYMYVGMFANRGTLVEFSNVEFVITGTSQGA